MNALMGICASCLGLNRHKRTDDLDETDPLLDDHQPQYGALPLTSDNQPDEEELRREQEALEQITNDAANHMIDVLHSRSLDIPPVHEPVPVQPSETSAYDNNHQNNGGDSYDEADESAWLDSLDPNGTSPMTEIKGLGSSALVIDISQLRQEAA